MTRLSFDEVNALVDGYIGGIPVRVGEVVDGILDYLIYAYVWGYEDVSEQLGKQLIPNATKMRETIYRKIADKNFEQRIKERVEAGDFEGVRVIAETEMHRDYNEAIFSAAEKGGATTKTWHTMEDDKVRQLHDYLDGISMPIDADFYVDGAKAPAPGMFGRADLDVNCRCYLTVN